MLAMVAHFPRNLGLQVQSQRLGRWQFEAKKKKKVSKILCQQQQKAGHGGACLSAQLHWKENLSPSLPTKKKYETLAER
jgi:hypothetical protein